MLKYFGKVHKKSKFLAILEGVIFKLFWLVGANHGGASSDSIECMAPSLFQTQRPGSGALLETKELGFFSLFLICFDNGTRLVWIQILLIVFDMVSV